MRGAFIVFEGIDGAGHSTHAGKLQNWIKNTMPNYRSKVIVTKEPTDGPIGAIIKLALEERIKLSPEALALAFATDRADHISYEILPKLREGYVVICDRYYLSSFAYQSVAGIDLNWLIAINSKCIRPDITILLDAPAEVCWRRIPRDRPHRELFKHPEKLENVRQAFKHIAKILVERYNEHIVIIDTEQPIESAHREVVTYVKEILERSNGKPAWTRTLIG